MKRKLLFVLFALCCVGWTTASGQPWSNILASSRAINWSNAGLPASLPDGEKTQNPWTPPTRTQCGLTIAAGASATTVNAALAACANGTYVLLGAGTFNFSSASITLYAQNGVTLRGSGAQSTKLVLSGTSTIAFGQSWSNGSCSWTAGYSVGATSLMASSCSGPTLVAGQLLVLTQCDTGWSGSGCSTGAYADNGGLYVCNLSSSCNFNGGSSTHNFQQQIVYVTSVVGSTINFSPGIYMPNWSSGQTPTVEWTSTFSSGDTASPYGNGLEDLTVDATAEIGGSNSQPVTLSNTYGSWIKGVRIIGTGANQTLWMN